MLATSCTKPRMTQGRSHSFDPLSGWCIFGCGNREDGRIVSRDGQMIQQGPNYSSQELAEIKANADRIIEARTPARTSR